MKPALGRALRQTRVRAVKLAGVVRYRPYRTALRCGVAAAVEHDRVPFGFDFATVVDVGASRGQFALVARRRFPGARLICIEPLGAAREALTAALGESAVEVHPFALGARSGMAELHIAGADDSSSLLPIGRRQVAEFPQAREVGRMEVPLRRLDELVHDVAPPCLVKIDVQGFELEVLRGADRLLPQVDAIYVECSFAELYNGQILADEVICYLHERGFRMRGVYGLVRGLDGTSLQADLLFSR